MEKEPAQKTQRTKAEASSGAVPEAEPQTILSFWNSFILRCGLTAHALFEHSSLSRIETEIICVLHQKKNSGKYGPAQIAELLKTSRQTMTGLLDSLEKKGFLKRQLNAKDRRRFTLKLTQKGCEFAEDFRGRIHERVMSIEKEIAHEDLIKATELLEKISQCLLQGTNNPFLSNPYPED